MRLWYTRDADSQACPSEPVLRAAVMARLGRDPVVEDAPASVSVSMTTVNGQLRALIETADLGQQGPGRRELFGDAGDCGELLSSVALAIAIAIDPQVLTRPTPFPSAEPTADKPAAPAPTAGRPQTPSQSKSALRAEHWYDLGWGAEATWRAVPGVGLTLSLRRATPVFSIALEVAGHTEQARSLEGGSVQVASLHGSVVGCWHLALLGACGHVGAGGHHLAASGYRDARQGWLPQWTFGPRLEAGGLLTEKVGLRLHLDATFSPQSVELTLLDEVIGTLPRLRLGAGASAFFRFR